MKVKMIDEMNDKQWSNQELDKTLLSTHLESKKYKQITNAHLLCSVFIRIANSRTGFYTLDGQRLQ